MPDTPEMLKPVPIPKGATVGIPQLAPPAPAPAAVAIPTGATIGQSEDEVAARHARSRIGKDFSQPLPALERGFAAADPSIPAVSNFLTGMGKEGLRTIQGATRLLNRGGAGLPVMGEELSTQKEGLGEHLGGLAENIVEFEAGTRLLKGLTLFQRIATAYPRLLPLARNNSTLAKMFVDAFKEAGVAGTVGAAQGAIKGEAEGKAGTEAKGGALGGFIGGLMGPALGAVGRMTGVSGLTAEEAMVRAGRPSVKADDRFRAAFPLVASRLLNAVKKFGVSTVGDFEDIIHNEGEHIMDVEFKNLLGAVDKQKTSAILAWHEIQRTISTQMQKYAPAQAEALDEFSKKFVLKRPTLGEVRQDIMWLNAQLRDFYKFEPRDMNAMLQKNASIAGYEAAARALRETLYTDMRQLGRPGAEKLMREYGALKDMESVMGHRATVVDRQNSISLPTLISVLTAIKGFSMNILHDPAVAFHTAAPLAALAVYKARNAAPSLIRRAVAAAAEEAGTPTVGTKVQRVLEQGGKSFLGALGALGGREGAAALDELDPRTNPEQPLF